MNHKTLLRSTAVLTLLGLVFGQFAFFSPAQAATPLAISFTSGPVSAFPTESVILPFTETFPDLSNYRNKDHMQVDTYLELTPPNGVALDGSTVRITDATGTQIGRSITLLANQTTIWASAFGGSLSRQPAQAVSPSDGTIKNYKLEFKPAISVTGSIGIKSTLVVARNSDFSWSKLNVSKTALISSPAATSITIYQKPVLDPMTISGPYTTNQSTQVQIKVNNTNGKAYSALKVTYSFGTPLPFSDFQYSMDGTNWNAVNTGIIGPASFQVSANTITNIYLKLTFSAAGTYPMTLELVDVSQPSAPVVLSTSSPSAIVKDPNAVSVPEVFSNDLAHHAYAAGAATTFTVTADNFGNNCNKNNNSLQITFTGGSGAAPSLQYLNASGMWVVLNPNQTGAMSVFSVPLSPNKCPWVVSVTYQVLFNASGTYTAALSLVNNTVPIASDPNYTITVSGAKPGLAINGIDAILAKDPVTDPNPGFRVGTISDLFSVTVTNPLYGENYAGSNLQLQYALSPADGSILYSPNNSSPLPSTSGTLADIIGSTFTPQSTDLTYQLAVKFANSPASGYTLTFKLVKDPSTPNEQQLATTSVVIYPDPIIPDTGRPFIYLPIVTN